MAGYTDRRKGPIGRVLLARRHKEQIIEKIKLNRVTIICAATGSGKSTQVPQMLVEEGLSPILCTQPRRIAVVSVAKLVAEELDCTIGEEVGYHIGQLNMATSRSKIVFQTAGVLFEQLKSNGVSALTKYKVVILDEVHERSVESDLVLACVKQLMLKRNPIRLVLMSATADFRRYEDYFSEFKSELYRITIHDFAQEHQQCLFQSRVKYLEQVVEVLGSRDGDKAMISTLEDNSCPYKQGTDIGTEIQDMIKRLVIHIHQVEADTKKSMLVFLPTYRALEDQWIRLKGTGLPLKIYVLHSSVDIKRSIKAMEACDLERKVILATDVAESSITIPGVAYVIDSCRCLQIVWNEISKRDLARVVWESHCQADQRKGRTGRTCDGTVYRLVPRSVYNQFDKYETPSIQLLSLRKQVLNLRCSEIREINDPNVLLQRCMNPPEIDTVQNALEALVSLKALQAQNHKGIYHPTFYGKLLAALPSSMQASMLVVHGCENSCLQEAAVLAALLDTTPLPIIQPFGSQNMAYFDGYYQGATVVDGQIKLNRDSVLLANLNAFEFWQSSFKDHQRLALLQHDDQIVYSMSDATKDMEEEWCERHHLSQFSVNAVAELSDCILEVMHRFRPCSISSQPGPSPSNQARAYMHTCHFTDSGLDYDPEENILQLEHCKSWPYVQSNLFREPLEEQQLLRLLSEVQAKYSQVVCGDEPWRADAGDLTDQGTQCVFFSKGMCMRGKNCPYSHSETAKPVVCKFFTTPLGCRYGSACRFRHEGYSPAFDVFDAEEEIDPGSFLVDYLPENNAVKKVLLLGEDALASAMYIMSFCKPSSIIVSVSEGQHEGVQSSPNLIHLLEKGIDILWNTNPIKGDSEIIPWKTVQSIIWTFPFEGLSEESESLRLQIGSFMSSLISIFKSTGCNISLLLNMMNRDYSRMQVQRVARDRFFFLESSFLLEEGSLGDCVPLSRNRMLPGSRLVTYAFKYCPALNMSEHVNGISNLSV